MVGLCGVSGWCNKLYFFRIGSKSNFEKSVNFFGVDPIFLHESSSWVEIRLHTEFGRVWLCRS